MFTYQKGMIRTSVRQLVEFLLREGDIHSQGALVADVEVMQAGSRIHRKIQKSQKETYQAEVPLKMEWEQDQYTLVLEGRADGIDRSSYGTFAEDEQITLEQYVEQTNNSLHDSQETIYYVDEIKGAYQNVMEYEEAKALHLAQAKCYAAIYLKQKDFRTIGVQVTYCNLDTEEIKRFHHIYEREELEEWFDSLIVLYKMWADYYMEARVRRQTSIQSLIFPFDYREGQKKLIAMVYHTISQKKKSFFQAPTGIGKTISAIYPSLKAMSEEKSEKIYYLTAKTITRTVAEDTLKLLRQQGLSMKAVTLTAKEKICSNDLCECNPTVCERAKGHYDRINGALYSMLTEEDTITREVILQYADTHQVCPYQLSMEATTFADFIICDYNYVFDPHVNRTSVQDDSEASRNILLIDEAHNLVERAREMYSAVLMEEDIERLRKIIPKSEKGLQKKLLRCRKEVKRIKEKVLEERKANKDEGYYTVIDDVDALYLPIYRLTEALMEYLTDREQFEDREEAVDIFFRMRHFQGIMETMTEGYRNYAIWSRQGFMIRLYCIDPSSQLKEIVEKNQAAIFFSATLLPMPYYRNLLYGEGADAFAIPSPFDSRKRLLCITSDVTSRYSRRNEEEYRKILSYVEKTVKAQKGNYMVFFPSYEMMERTLELLDEREMEGKVDVIVQEATMDERQKEDFLEEFQENRERSLVGFCVLGSIFSEGIDLSGRRLIGALIVGTGLPKMGLSRDMIRAYFDNHDKKGYDYAYRYPGMNKVLQAAGRVIRSIEDRGIILLMDERFLWKENQYLLPEDWDRYYEVNLHNYSGVVEQFWKDIDES